MNRWIELDQETYFAAALLVGCGTIAIWQRLQGRRDTKQRALSYAQTSPNAKRSYWLFMKRQRGLRSLRANSVVGIIGYWFGAVGSVVSALGLGLGGLTGNRAVPNGMPTTWSMIVGAVGGLGTLWVLRRMYRQSQPLAESLDTFKPLPSEDLALLRDMVRSAADKMGLFADQIPVYVRRGTLAGPPQASATEDRNGPRIILSIPFLAFMHAKPRQAAAVLVHELAHVEQKDVNLWLLIDAAWSVNMYLLLPLYTVQLVVAFWTLPAGPAAVLASPALAMFVGFHAIRHLQRQSERWADAAVVLFGDGAALLEVLDFMPAKRRRIYDQHPSISWRRKQARHMLCRLTGPGPSSYSPTSPGVDQPDSRGPASASGNGKESGAATARSHSGAP